jgi:ATP-binding cassette, subfamily B, bacterial
MKSNTQNPLNRFVQLLYLEKKDISAIYLYAVLGSILLLIVPLGIQAIINYAMAGSLNTSLIVMIFLVVLGVSLAGMLQINQMKLIEKIQQRIFVRYSYEFSYTIPKLDISKIDNVYLPELVNRFFETSTLQKSLSKILLDIPAALIQILFSLMLLSLYSGVYVYFSMLTLLLLYIVIRYTSRLGLQTAMIESDQKYAMAEWLEEIARAIKTFKIAKNSNLPIINADKIAYNYVEARTKHFKILLVQYWSLIGFKVLVTGGMLLTGAYLLVGNKINIGQFVAAEIVILTIIGSIEKVMQSLDTVYDLLTGLEKLNKVIEKPVETQGKIAYKSQPKGMEIIFKDFSFAYGTEPYVLKDLNLTINANQKVCIYGVTGSGKSTILNVLSHSYRNYQGRILIDGINQLSYDIDSLRANSGYYFSTQDIFSGSLIENITLSNDNISTENVYQLAEKVGLSEYIKLLPDGYNTQLDQVGRRLPSQIAKKILLLRAIVDDPKLILLEEPTFEFTEEKEKNIFYNYLKNEIPNTTVIIVSNDPEIKKICDQIISL